MSESKDDVYKWENLASIAAMPALPAMPAMPALVAQNNLRTSFLIVYACLTLKSNENIACLRYLVKFN